MVIFLLPDRCIKFPNLLQGLLVEARWLEQEWPGQVGQVGIERKSEVGGAKGVSVGEKVTWASLTQALNIGTVLFA